MDGLIINDEVYKLVEDGEDFDCKDCDLLEYCGNFDESICTASFINKDDNILKKLKKLQ